MLNGLSEIKNKFIIRKGFFNQTYLSVRTGHFELTLDNLITKRNGARLFTVSLCTPYREGIDKRKHHNGVGAGEVKNSWEFEDEIKALEFISRTHLI